MSTLRVTLFGRFNIWHDGQPIRCLSARKAQELFCIMLLQHGQPQHRERIAGLMWGDVRDAMAKRYLSKALWQLQAALDAAQPGLSTQLVKVEPEWIQLNPGASIWLDASCFEKIYMALHQRSGGSLQADQAQVLEAAVHLYRGEFLDGWYQDWCILERQRFRHMLLTMLDKLMDFCEVHLQFESALDHGRRILYHDRAREYTHRRLMRLLYLLGDRTGALRQYEECTRALEEELGVVPSATTQLLCERIRAGQLLNDQEPAVDNVVGPPAATGIQQILTRLNRLQATAKVTNAQLRKEIEALKILLQHRSW